jgi:integrase
MTINIICRNEKERIDAAKKASLVLLIKFNKKNYKISSGEKCKPESWEKSSQKVNAKFNGSAQINSRLLKSKVILQDIINSQRDFDIKKIRTIFSRYLLNPDDFNINDRKESLRELNFSEIIENVINKNRSNWSHGHKKKFKSLRTKILDFSPDFKIEDLSQSWWQDYVDYCFDEKGNRHNTVQTDLKALRSLCEQLKYDDYKFNTDFLSVSMPYIEPKIEPLYWDEIKRIANLDLSGPTLKKYEDSRYIWVLCAYLGLRWSDITRISEENFSQKTIIDKDNNPVIAWRYSNRAQKTKNLIDIPLLPDAVEWLEKREFKIPKLCQQTVNKNIKEIAKEANLNDIITIQRVFKNEVVEVRIPKWKNIRIHTARHSFAVELVKRSIGKPYADKFVSEMLGHSSYATTWKYFNFVSPEKDKIFFELMNSAYN